jgi:hypothetical protein
MHSPGFKFAQSVTASAPARRALNAEFRSVPFEIMRRSGPLTRIRIN